MKDSTGLQLTDQETGSVWNLNGRCLEGKLSGTNLKTVRSSQEFWHSWKDFNPNTLRD
ncbi:MAG: DUF3179 domain-containing protein [Bacteroidetes bacterium]|nr:DUF3179 domain-containing protein [Bacteroidota bacterium]